MSCMPHSFHSYSVPAPPSPYLCLFQFVCLFLMPVLFHLPVLDSSAQTLYLLPHCVGDFFTLHFRIVLGSPHFCDYKNINSAAFHSSFVSPGGRGDLYMLLLSSDLAYFCWLVLIFSHLPIKVPPLILPAHAAQYQDLLPVIGECVVFPLRRPSDSALEASLVLEITSLFLILSRSSVASLSHR